MNFENEDDEIGVEGEYTTRGLILFYVCLVVGVGLLASWPWWLP